MQMFAQLQEIGSIVHIRSFLTRVPCICCIVNALAGYLILMEQEMICIVLRYSNAIIYLTPKFRKKSGNIQSDSADIGNCDMRYM